LNSSGCKTGQNVYVGIVSQATDILICVLISCADAPLVQIHRHWRFVVPDHYSYCKLHF